MTTTTISKLKALSSPSSTTRYFLSDEGKEGFFKYDSSDKTSVGDDINVIVSGNGKRFKRIFLEQSQIFETVVEPPIVEDPPVVEPPPVEPPVIDMKDVSALIKPNTDNAAILNKIAADNAGKGVLINLSSPLITSDNTWTKGLKKLVINGGAVQKIGSNVWNVSKDPFNIGGLLTYNHKEFAGGYKTPTYLFSSAKAGDISIKTTAPLNPGDWVLVYGYECQGQGWPINPRFKEWKKVASINPVTFTEPLKYSYNDQWKDWLFPDNYKSGKPRILKINPEYMELAQFTGVSFPQHADGFNAFHVRVMDLICDKCDFSGAVWASENRTARYINCTGGGWEIDKVCDLVEVINGNIGGEVQAATSINMLRLINTKFANFCAITPQNLYAEGNTFGYKTGNASVYAFEYYTGCDTWTFKNNTFPVSSGMGPVYIPVKEFVIADLQGSNIILPDATNWDSPNHMPAKLIYQGSKIWSKDGKASAIVDDIIYNGSYVLQLSNITGTLTKGMTMQYRQVKKVVDLGGNKLADGTPIIIK
jgi:hypothetical protein